jgi:large subunit ribosomal protein L29
MRADEIREMSADDIRARVGELEEERFRLRFRSASEPLENPLRLRTIRRDIARLKTILTQKERGVETGTKTAKRAPKAGASAPKRERKRVKNG